MTMDEPGTETDEVVEFFSEYPTSIRNIALQLRAFVRSALPRAEERLDRPDRVVGYGFGPGYADLICTIIPSKRGVKLGIVRGAEMPDPKGLLEGPGKRHHYVAFAELSDLKRVGLKRLLTSALAAWRKRRAGIT